jgi:GntR family transcriptional regulator / MocR family aminotransferase
MAQPGPAGGLAPAILLDRRRAAYRTIYERFRQAILAGNLVLGARLPSARTLAAQLGIARGTVDAAYELLANEGYVVTRGAAGTLVNPGLDRRALRALRGRDGRATAAPAAARTESSAQVLPFQMGLPALDAFPRKVWARLVARRGRALSSEVLSPGIGLPRLRREIATYLGVARGIVTTAENVVITGGFQGALGLIVHALLRRGDRVWLEEPGYRMTRLGLVGAGARPDYLPVDGGGIAVGEGVRRAAGARFAVVTPSHESPLGVTLSLARRLALLAWAGRMASWVIEDDYDGEFRYLGPPLPALKSLDGEGRVLYAGTFSKVLLPILRLGYLVVPDAEIGRFTETARLLAPAPALLVQEVVADFIADGHFAAHIRRMRLLYQERRAALAEALSASFGDRLAVALEAGGMHLLARPRRARSDTLLVAQAKAAGLAPSPLSPCYAGRTHQPGLLLGFTNTPVERAAADAERLLRAIAPSLRYR